MQYISAERTAPTADNLQLSSIFIYQTVISYGETLLGIEYSVYSPFKIH